MFPSADSRQWIVTVEQRPSTDAVDASGAPTDEPWTKLYVGKFSKDFISGRERFTAQQMSAPYDTRWKSNYRRDMDADLVDVCKLRRLVYKGRVHDIVAASVVGRNEEIELLTLSGGTVS